VARERRLAFGDWPSSTISLADYPATGRKRCVWRSQSRGAVTARSRLCSGTGKGDGQFAARGLELVALERAPDNDWRGGAAATACRLRERHDPRRSSSAGARAASASGLAFSSLSSWHGWVPDVRYLLAREALVPVGRCYLLEPPRLCVDPRAARIWPPCNERVGPDTRRRADPARCSPPRGSDGIGGRLGAELAALPGLILVNPATTGCRECGTDRLVLRVLRCCHPTHSARTPSAGLAASSMFLRPPLRSPSLLRHRSVDALPLGVH